MDFVFATSEVNRYGYRVLVEGIRLDNYRKNPVLLYMHARSGDRFPIGRVDNLRVEDGKLMGTPVFDEQDKMGAEAKRKVENKFLFATSIYHDPITITDNPDLLLAGQTRATVAECDLLEISFVDIPGDPRAVQATQLNLSEGASIDDVIPTLNFSDNMEKPTMPVAVLTALSLSADATPEQAVAAIDELKKTRASALLAFGESKGVVTDANRAAYEKLASGDFGATMELLSASDGPDTTGEGGDNSGTDTAQQEGMVQQLLAAAGKLSAGNGQQQKDERDSWTYDDWQRKDEAGLYKLKLNDPEKYEALALAYAKS